MALTDERKLLLLGILRQSEMHGYLLNAHLDGAAPISLKKPTAYNLLERMHTDGWVSYRDEPTGDRPRRVYALTETGEQAFLRLLRKQLQHFAPARISIPCQSELSRCAAGCRGARRFEETS